MVITKTTAFYSAGILCILLSAACNNKTATTATTDYTMHHDTIVISAGSPLADKIKTAPVQETPYQQQLFTAGTVRAIPTQYAEIAPPFKGRVTRSYLSLGMSTTPETPLFEISSPDFVAAQKIFFQEKSQLEQAQRNYQRQQDLVAHGVGTQKDLEEAQTAYDVEKKEYENALAGIRIFKADPTKLSLGQPLVVRAPISGQVIENKVILGQFIKDDATSVATVANLSRIWIVGQVKEKDIRHIHIAGNCSIEAAALPGKLLTGSVYHINDIVDESTRSVEVLIEVDNHDHALKPGMYVTVNFTNAAVPSVLIPSRAVMQANDAGFVFVQTAPGAYVRRKVVATGASGEQVVIASGLDAGEKIITEGGFYLLEAK